jgi:integrase
MTKTKYPGIYKTEDGRWHVRVTVQIEGRRIQKRQTLDFGAKLADARFVVDELRRVATEETRQDPLTVNDFAERWLEDKAARMRVSTGAQLERVLAYHILPELGLMRLSDLRREHITKWVLKAERKRRHNGSDYAAESVKGWWRVLCQFLRDAVAEGYLDSDPIIRIRPPMKRTKAKQERRTLNAEQLGSLLHAVKECSPHRFAELLLLASTGMRTGELFALEWNDLRNGMLQIERSVWHGHVASTKTGDPRTVPVPDAVMDVLREHRASLIRQQHPGVASGLMFPSRIGSYRSNTSLVKALRNAQAHARIEIHVTPKVLRRTFNTLMISAGVDRIVLRSMMGHSSEEMTERYAGVPEEMKRSAVISLTNVLMKLQQDEDYADAAKQ